MTDEREDLLIHRALLRDASREDWDALRAIAVSDPGVWRRLALRLEDDGALARVAAATVECSAARVDLPSNEELAAAPAPATTEVRRHARILTGALGWAAAALLLVAWIGERHRPAVPIESGKIVGAETVAAPPRAGESGDVAPAFARSPAASEVQIVSELPVRMLDTRPAEDGEGYDVLVLRRTVERHRVDTFFRLAEDEHGQMVPLEEPIVPSGPLERL